MVSEVWVPGTVAVGFPGSYLPVKFLFCLCFPGPESPYVAEDLELLVLLPQPAVRWFQVYPTTVSLCGAGEFTQGFMHASTLPHPKMWKS